MADPERITHPFDGHVNHLKQIIPVTDQIFTLLKNLEWYPFPLRKGKNSSRTLCNHHVSETSVGKALNNWLVELFQEVNVTVKVLGMFGNYYPDGESTLPHHRDQYNADVISLSFGATRLFNFKSDSTKRVVKPSLYLTSGDVLIFDQHMNDEYTHGIPLQKQIKEPRINVTCFVEFEKGDPYMVDSNSMEIPNITISENENDNDEDLAKMLQALEWSH